MSSSKVTIVRPSNTTAYTAGNAIGQADIVTPANAGSAVLKFANFAEGGSVFITDLSLDIFLTAVPSGMTSFRLHFYDSAPDALLDGAAWVLTSTGDKTKYLGYLDISAVAVDGGLLHFEVSGLNKKVAPAGRDLYAKLVTNGGYTPTSGETYILRLGGLTGRGV